MSTTSGSRVLARVKASLKTTGPKQLPSVEGELVELVYASAESYWWVARSSSGEIGWIHASDIEVIATQTKENHPPPDFFPKEVGDVTLGSTWISFSQAAMLRPSTRSRAAAFAFSTGAPSSGSPSVRIKSSVSLPSISSKSGDEEEEYDDEDELGATVIHFQAKDDEDPNCATTGISEEKELQDYIPPWERDGFVFKEAVVSKKKITRVRMSEVHRIFLSGVLKRKSMLTFVPEQSSGSATSMAPEDSSC